MTGNLCHGLGLSGQSRNLVAGTGLLGAGILHTHCRGTEQVVYSGLDSIQLGVHLLAIALCLRVVGTGVVLQAAVHVSHIVVLVNHALDACVADTNLYGYKFILVVGVVDISTHLAYQAQFGLKRNHLLVVARTGLQQGAGCSLGLRQLRLAFQLLNLGVHIVQFARDKRDTIGDELLGLLGYLVLILDGVVVVYGNQRVDNLVGPLTVVVGIGNAEYRCHLVDTAHVQVAYHAACQREHLLHADVERHTVMFGTEELGLVDDYHHRVVEVHRLAEGSGALL